MGGYTFGKEKLQHDWMLTVIYSLVNEIRAIQGQLGASDALGMFYRDTYDDIRAIATNPLNVSAWAFGKNTVADGMTSLFDWVAGDTSADDGVNVLRPNDYNAAVGGTWKRRL